MLAKIGINSSGFAVTLNILRTGEDGQRSGIPVHVLLRVLLDCHSVQEARDVMAGLSFSSSSNIMVADKTGDVASFELSPLGCKVLEPADGYLCHTNHFLDEALAVHDVGRPGNQSTIKRLHKARQRVTDSMSFEQIQSVLCDESDGIESICRLPDPSLPPIACIETVCTVIMNTSQGTLAVSGAQPSISEFKHYSLG